MGPNDLSVSGILTSWAASQMDQARYEEAEALFRRALEISEAGPASDEDLGMALGNLGALYLAWDRPARAEPYVKRSVEIGERLLGSDHLRLGLALNSLGVLYWEMGDYESALDAYGVPGSVHVRRVQVPLDLG